MPHDFLSVYPAKAMEYLLAVSYLLLFIPFWRYVQGNRRPALAAEAALGLAPAAEAAAAPAKAARARRPDAGWFDVPGSVWLHPGHTWARLEADGTVAVGLDDLARRLVVAEKTDLPSVGAHVAQGEAAVALEAGRRTVRALSPVDGTVVAVHPEGASARDTYGEGWLFKVKPRRLASNLRQLHQGASARRLLDDASAFLAARAAPELGAVLQDGGTPVHGIAEAVAGDRWDELASELLRS
jgi:glycine cleavage system H protein